MADKKISALAAATTPLAGTEVLPIVQDGATVKVAVSNLTAGRNVSMADLTTTGNTTLGNASSDTLNVGNGDIVKNSSGNMGIGVSPSPWSTSGTWFRSLDMKNGGALASFQGVVSTQLITNAYFDGGAWVYKVDGAAGRYANNGDTHIWYKAPSGVANNPVSFTEIGGFDANDNFKINIGNLVQGTAGKGVNFTANTPAAGMTSQLLNWYEEGTWTPNQGAGLTLVGAFSSAGTYTRIGRQVFIRGSVSGATSVAVASAGAITTNLPYSAAADATGTAINAANNASSILRVSSATLTAATAIAATTTITFSAVYSV